MSNDSDNGIQNVKLGPVRFVPGITKWNAATVYYAGFFSIASTVFLSVFQGYIFTELLHIPQDEQGKLAGKLVAYSELVILCLIGVAGVLSDKIGRRPVYVFGFVFLGIGYALYPLATSEDQLVMFRMVFALGVVGATSMLATVQADYPVERDRGKLVGSMGFLQAVGVVAVIFTLPKLPKQLTAGGMSPEQAGQITLWIFAAICVFNAVVLAIGLKGGTPSTVAKREGFIPTLKRGIEAGKNPRVALSYVAAMVSRGDLSTVSTFFSLWVMQVGISKGMATADALKAGAMFFVIVTIAATVWAPVVGILCDRMNRVTALCMAMTLATCGYLIAGFLPDPTSALMYPAAILLGMAEVNAVLAAQTLIGQEAPKEGRGSVIGVFGVCGGIGILAAGTAGGYLFDEWRPSAPFILMGGANFVLLMIALFVRSKWPGPMPQDMPRVAAGH